MPSPSKPGARLARRLARDGASRFQGHLPAIVTDRSVERHGGAPASRGLPCHPFRDATARDATPGRVIVPSRWIWHNPRGSTSGPTGCFPFHSENNTCSSESADLPACHRMTCASFAENLTIPVESRPGWLAKDGIVMAGSWEPLLFRVRRDGGSGYEPTPEQREAYRREHSPEMIAELKGDGRQLHHDALLQGRRSAGERESMADAVRFSELCHSEGLRVGVYNYSGAFIWELFFKEVPQAKDWLVLDESGNPRPTTGQRRIATSGTAITPTPRRSTRAGSLRDRGHQDRPGPFRQLRRGPRPGCEFHSTFPRLPESHVH